MMSLIFDGLTFFISLGANCVGWNIMIAISFHFYCAGGSLLGVRLLLKDQFERKKSLWVQRQMTVDLRAEVKKHKDRLTTFYLVVYWLCMVAISLTLGTFISVFVYLVVSLRSFLWFIVVLVRVFAGIPSAIIAGCDVQSPWLYSFDFWLVVEYVVIVVTLIHKLRNVREAFGLKVHLRVCFML